MCYSTYQVRFLMNKIELENNDFCIVIVYNKTISADGKKTNVSTDRGGFLWVRNK